MTETQRLADTHAHTGTAWWGSEGHLRRQGKPARADRVLLSVFKVYAVHVPTLPLQRQTDPSTKCCKPAKDPLVGLGHTDWRTRQESLIQFHCRCCCKTDLCLQQLHVLLRKAANGKYGPKLTTLKSFTNGKCSTMIWLMVNWKIKTENVQEAWGRKS